MIQIKVFEVNPWGENTYIVYDETHQAVIIDAGCFTTEEEQQLKNFIDQNNLKPVYLLNTHLHIDHILGNHFVKKTYGLSPLAHENDEFLIDQTLSYANQLGLKLKNDPPYPSQYIDEGQILLVGNFQIEVIHVPGHTPGHLVFYIKEHNILFTGDVLFNLSIGRTDLIYGNYDALIKGIFYKILPLPDNTLIYPGHGESTNVGFERANNPFLKHYNFN
ncbi:MAG TPA: MBL fold metallo-hydrolase [Salinivirgaceae bacterium]|nr:MBL fold metallo-hydrolase [Salinivirgaceae bacterium]